MLRNVLIMASSGIVLFSKEYVNGVAQVRTPTLNRTTTHALSLLLLSTRSLTRGYTRSATHACIHACACAWRT